MSERQEIVKEFLAESRENLDRVEQLLVAWERDPDSRERLEEIFRAIHTLKGSAAFLEFHRLEQLAHAGEELLAPIRGGQVELDSSHVTAVLALVDTARTILTALEHDGHEGAATNTTLIARLEELQHRDRPEPPVRSAGVTDSRAAERNLRVDVALVDQLLNLVGELVLTRDRLGHLADEQEGPGLRTTVQQLGVIIGSLQSSVLKMRMKPIESLWATFPRVVRDLALQSGKLVRMVMDGQNTELDRRMIEVIKDPLTHLIRNAVDHGIEPPEVRRAAGKPLEGLISMRAFQASGRAVVEVSDDGAGIDRVAVRRKAETLGLIDRAAPELNDRDVLGLIFHPGFSTAATVTSVSGRGVGMDVVRTNIERVGGSVEIKTEVGAGTSFSLTVPLTLAIVPALVIASGGNRYAIPRAHVLELVRFDPEAGARRIETIHGAPVYRLRDTLLPIVDLGEALSGQHHTGPSADRWQRSGPVFMVVLEVDRRSFGLVVDDVFDVSDVVVKPFSAHAHAPSHFSAATILADGNVVLILDVPALAYAAHVFAGSSEAALPIEPRSVNAKATQSLLLLTGRYGERMAVPLEPVSRLEEIPAARLERLGDEEVVQYRGRILRLVRLSDVLVERRRRPRGNAVVKDEGAQDWIQVVVCHRGDGEVGLLVDEIVDIAEEELSGKTAATRTGVLFSAVIRNHVTEVLDLDKLLPQANVPA